MTDNNDKMSRVAQKQKKEKTTLKNNGKPKMKLWKKILLSLIGIGLVGLISGAGLFAYYASSAPALTEKDLRGVVSSKILDIKGNVIKEIGSENREVAEGDEIPQQLKDAITSIEDRRFYKHFGIDPIRIGGAVVANLTRGFASEGGSTLTQQLVKLSVFSTKASDQTIKRKAQEAWLSIKLEREYSKEQILEFYLNKVYLANNNYGMAKASKYYYGKTLKELSLAQLALLAGMPQAPADYDPYVNPEDATKRRNLVLDAMYENKKISASERDTAKAEDVKVALVDHSTDNSSDLVIDAYLEQVIAEVEKKTKLNIFTDGLTIHTNLDMDAQKHLYDTLNTDQYVAYPDDQLQAGVSMVDVNTGQIRALGGNRKQTAQRGLNRATSLKRSIGSTMKPLADYAPAIEFLNYSTYQQVTDAPYTYSNGIPLYNYDRAYKGQMSIREAIEDSRNIPALKTLQAVGLDKSNQFLQGLGINIEQSDGVTKGLVESNAIGGDVTPLNLSAAYAAFANGGTYYEPYAVSKVVLQNDKEIDLSTKGTQAMKDSTAYMMTDMLKDVIKNGTGTNAQIPNLPQAGKTGTTNYDDTIAAKFPASSSPDAWFSGYTTNYSISVWVGYDDPNADNHDLNPRSQKLPGLIYKELMSYVSANIETKDWKKPNSVVSSPVLKGSDPAKKPSAYTPSSNILQELFVKGFAPTEVSSGGGGASSSDELPQPTGLSASYDATKNSIAISWNDYQFKNANYTLTVGGQSYTTADKKYTVLNPSEGTVTITLTATVGGQTSPSVSTSVEVPVKAIDSSSVDSSKEEPASSSSSSSVAPPESSSTEPPASSSESSSSESSSSSSDSTVIGGSASAESSSILARNTLSLFGFSAITKNLI
ncbi:PBP1A family penicillin-binding protein [Carnobacterium gallinarum]|uniref:PBP1A family penicillin-binding protein n=1 Tax=Carnobacterium gallinarum TaxID=2749 RepID=UPI0005500212|nr:PBP1A family penicillin-binding protein [Carnobacterium gallinarum]